jgi:hypothetical protein
MSHDSQTTLEHKTPESNKSVELYALQWCSQSINDQSTYDAPQHQHDDGWNSDRSRQRRPPCMFAQEAYGCNALGACMLGLADPITE